MDNIIITGNKITRSHVNRITTADIEHDLLRYKYTGMNLEKNEEVERARIPYFAVSFYNFIFTYKRIPSPSELLTTYISQPYFKDCLENPDFISSDFDGHHYEALSTSGIKARLLRAYPSLIRDFHFSTLCRESGKFENVFYSLNEDLLKGNDLCVTYGGKEYKIALMVGTKRSEEFANRKQNFRHDAEERISLYIDRNNAKWCGDYMLYGESFTDEIIKQINVSRETKGE